MDCGYALPMKLPANPFNFSMMPSASLPPAIRPSTCCDKPSGSLPLTWVTMNSTSCCETSGDRLNFCDTIWAISFITAPPEECADDRDAAWNRPILDHFQAG